MTSNEATQQRKRAFYTGLIHVAGRAEKKKRWINLKSVTHA